MLDLISSKPGPWRTDFTPYTRGPMDAFTDKEIERIILVWGSQSAKTECINNMIGYLIDQDPGPTALVYPEESTGKFSSNRRLQPMITSTISIADKFNVRSKELELDFTDMFIAILSANSPSQTASRPVRYLFRDEIDKYEKWSGDEASPMKLTEERTKAFPHNKKIVDASTPVTKNKNIWPAYMAADVRYKYHVPCPHCKAMQPFVFRPAKKGDRGGVKWPEEIKDNPKLVEDVAWYECAHCGGKISDSHKQTMLRLGEWVSENKPIGRIRTVAYHLNSIYSPFVSFGRIAREFLESKDTPSNLMNFVNSWLAEPWENKASRLKSDIVLEKQLDYEQGRVFDKAQLLTLGVDVQLNHFWWGVRAWGPKLTSWLVDYGRVETWAEIENIIYRPYPTTLGEAYYINLACIDSGYNTDEVYQFCAEHQGICLPTKGSSKPLKARYTVTKLDKFFGLLLYNFDPNQFKDFIAGRLTVPAGAPGSWNVYQGCDRRYADMICSEQKIEQKDKKGRVTYEWQPISSHAQNHMLDVEVNCALAAEIAGVRYLVEPEIVIPVPPIEREARKSNWLRR
ncbi:terminase gpA endonuclease subunit [Sporomusa sphaeroides]|uniref:terminase gpA endonuclease subunit n=1 Tax=Sporomusa sphaeroides TaxID=47679 RepID=UPI00130177FB|nr:terminase gpA endonuclease subunit [Sporomusa sphaeroides]